MRGNGANASKMSHEMNTLEIFRLLLLLVSVLPAWPHSANEEITPAGDRATFF